MQSSAYSPLRLESSKTQRQRTPADKETHHHRQAMAELFTDILIKEIWHNALIGKTQKKRMKAKFFVNGFRNTKYINSFFPFLQWVLTKEQE